MRSVLAYDPLTGELRWRVTRGKGYAGNIAGRVNSYGYRRLRVFDRHYQAHRVAWLIFYGCWPVSQLDHINGDRLDNRISNLRDVSPAVNQHNRRRAQRGSASGAMGVHPSRTKWRARIELGGRKFNVGTFSTIEEAGKAYLEAKRQLHEGCTL
jgi:hypothetical protein